MLKAWVPIESGLQKGCAMRFEQQQSAEKMEHSVSVGDTSTLLRPSSQEMQAHFPAIRVNRMVEPVSLDFGDQASLYGKDNLGLSESLLITQAKDFSEKSFVARKDSVQLERLSETKARSIEVHEHVSSDYSSKVQQWWNSVPADIYNQANHAGIRAVVVNNAKDIFPDAAQVAARGHLALGGETMAQQPMFYHPGMHAMIFAEHPDVSGSQQLRQSKGVQEIPVSSFDETYANHELGHGLDFAVLKHMSSSVEFDQAFKKGQERLVSNDHVNWRYFVEPSVDQRTGRLDYQAAKEELTAQLYALTHKAFEKLSREDKLMLNKFHEVVDLMKEHGIVRNSWQFPKL